MTLLRKNARPSPTEGAASADSALDRGASTEVEPGLGQSEMDLEELTARQAIRRAALRSSLKLADSATGGRPAEALSAHLLNLAELIVNNAFDHASDAFVPIAPLPAGRLLETLRRDLLEEMSLLGHKVSATTVVRILRAIDEIADRIHDDPSHRFISRFLGAAGLEALVEVAHDMRSPLASIVLLSETLRLGQSGSVNEIQERQLALIYSATLGLSLLANDVIELAHGDEREAQIGSIAFSVHELMLSVGEIVKPIAEEKKLDLRIDPPAADWRMGHPTALHRILLNLTTNALKFTDSGFVSVAARQASRTVLEFSVTDSGRGLPDQLIPYLFDAFREDSTGGNLTFSSSGLGLAICRKFVRALGGELRAENVDSGARFSFLIDLPLAKRM